MECVILIGAQGSGKSTFYQQQFFFTHLHLSLEILKTRQRELRFVDFCASVGQRFVIDNTNPTITERQVYIQRVKAAHFQVKAYYFEPNFQRCWQLNQQRQGKHCVPEVALKATLKKLELPHFAEGFDQIFRVDHDQKGGFEIHTVNQEDNNAF